MAAVIFLDCFSCLGNARHLSWSCAATGPGCLHYMGRRTVMACLGCLFTSKKKDCLDKRVHLNQDQCGGINGKPAASLDLSAPLGADSLVFTDKRRDRLSWDSCRLCCVATA